MFWKLSLVFVVTLLIKGKCLHLNRNVLYKIISLAPDKINAIKNTIFFFLQVVVLIFIIILNALSVFLLIILNIENIAKHLTKHYNYL